MAQGDVKTVDNDGKVEPKRRFDVRDWNYIAEYVRDEHSTRKAARSTLEKIWKDIDRQVAMEPEISFKKLPNGKMDTKKAWMAETELPLQAQALEVLKADARRLSFPDSAAWFRAHAAVTDEYLASVDYKSLILGDENDVPSRITQDNADKLVEGFLTQIFRTPVKDEDFFTRMDRINAESFKYGVGLGRARIENKALYVKTPYGVRKDMRRIPVLMPGSIKNVYLDDPQPSTHSAQSFEPAHISVDMMKLENLQAAASAGSNDPDDADGGWMPHNIKGLVGDNKGYVTLLEMEGTIVVPRKTTRSIIIPNAIVTVAMGGKSGGKQTSGVVRFRFNNYSCSSWFLFPYNYEGADCIYPTSPLMKGRPVQIMATDALNKLMDSSALKIAPPVSYDKTDLSFAPNGGPPIHPYALWASADAKSITAHTDIGGEPSAMAGVLVQAINLYAELTGVLPARLGAQTNSHTTAFAKDAELQRGAVRTVNYVRQSGHGPMTRWLCAAYEMGREAIGSRETVSFYIDGYGGYVEVGKEQLPERATFEWFGAGGPADEQQKTARRLAALQFGLQMDQIGAAMGKPPRINLDGAIDQTLRDGGWTDIDAVVSTTPPVSAVPALGPGPAVAALQQLTGPVVE